jgi:hypothetical protein
VSATLTALAVVAVGYVLTAVVFNRLSDRYGYVGGAEYVVLGVLFGPRAANLLTADALRDLTPLLSLALGWMGMHLGTFFRLPTLAQLDPTPVSIAFTEATLTFLASLGLLLGLFTWGLGLPWAVAVLPAVALAAIATMTAPAAIDALERRHGERPIFRVLQLTTRVDCLIGTVAFGLLLAILHQGEVASTVRPPTATEWAVINIAVGVASGVLFHLFLGPREEQRDAQGDARLFVSLAGAAVVASGAAYYLNFSPIFTNLILGFILANTGGAHRDVARLLESSARPVFLALLIVAGAAWAPGAPEHLFIAPAYIALRIGARLFGGRIAGTWGVPPALRTPALGRTLLAQGSLSVAVAVNYTQVLPGLMADIVLTCALLSVLLFEVVARPEAEAVLSGTEARPAPIPDEGSLASEAAR